MLAKQQRHTGGGMPHEAWWSGVQRQLTDLSTVRLSNLLCLLHTDESREALADKKAKTEQSRIKKLAEEMLGQSDERLADMSITTLKERKKQSSIDDDLDDEELTSASASSTRGKEGAFLLLTQS